MRVLITGANGFIGRNLLIHLSERKDIEVVYFGRENSVEELPDLLSGVNFVFHLAGISRPEDPSDFTAGNTILSQQLANAMLDAGCKAPILYASSTQAGQDNPYGLSKLAAEHALLSLLVHGIPVSIFRLPNVFGKWARPNHNSAVATFCYNISRDLPVQINDPNKIINLVYIDDVVAAFMDMLDGRMLTSPFAVVQPQYSISVGALVDQLLVFRDSRQSLVTEHVGSGLVRALYSTYVSYLPPERFAYDVLKYGDPRGVFVEMLKTKDSGQFSYFTAHPGITRGGHYHHSKTEKFLVIKGKACFRFRHIVSGEFYELFTTGDAPQVVETVPGWTHDITNVGDDEMIVMLWANEIFDRERPDTYARPVGTAP